jgi:hypothetical protein
MLVRATPPWLNLGVIACFWPRSVHVLAMMELDTYNGRRHGLYASGLQVIETSSTSPVVHHRGATAISRCHHRCRGSCRDLFIAIGPTQSFLPSTS